MVKIERIKNIDGITNEKVVKIVKEERTLLQTFKMRKGNWIGHVIRR